MLRASQLRFLRLAGLTRERFTLRIVAAHGLPGYRAGSRATLLLFNSTDLRQDCSIDV